MSNATDDREVSRLESVPGEILNTIYRHTVIEDGFMEAVKSSQKSTTTPHQRLWTSNEPPLARTCRRFRKEVLPIYYSENIFRYAVQPWECTVFESIATFQAWITSIGQSASYIRRIGAHARDGWPFQKQTNRPDVIVDISQDGEQAEFSLSEKGIENIDKAHILDNAHECWSAVPTGIRKVHSVAIALVISERLFCVCRPQRLARSIEAVIKSGDNWACND